MKRCMVFSLAGACSMVLLLGPQVGRAGRRTESKVRFAPLHIYVDSGSRPLAAYQFELKATTGQIKIVGVEGGQHAAFREPPYYDPAALAQDRIIIAAFNTGRDLPQGRTRIATVHLQIIGDAEPEYEIIPIAAADPDGREFPAELAFERGAQK